MLTTPISVDRTRLRFLPDSSRVLLRPFTLGVDGRITRIISRVLTLPDAEVRRLLSEVLDEFADRHLQIQQVFEKNFARVARHIPKANGAGAGASQSPAPLDRGRQLLIGAYFTHEYALESAALFNPSIVAHPDQSGLAPGELRFAMSLRATGEGHISSIEFRGGVIGANNEIVVDPVNRFVNTPEVIADPSYDKPVFRRKLAEMGFEASVQDILEPLPDVFTAHELNASLAGYRKKLNHRFGVNQRRTIESVLWLARSNYELQFPDGLPLSERIIFPVSDNESNGIEDARFVRFVEDDGSVMYYATYTAYNGRVILPMLLRTPDFQHFKINTLNGKAVQNKGMALFPRRIDGHYAMISRQDNENLFLMLSDHPYFWEDTIPLQQPAESWELIQLGNCGSPIETEAGWLLLTHGVGPMRKYCIGAMLLDLHDPRKVIGRLRQPLLKPNANEREGYVPNVVYTCGALVHEGRLIMPYAMSDSASSVAIIQLDELLAHLHADGP